MSSNVKIVGNRDILLLHVKLKAQDVSNIIDLIRSNTTGSLPSTAKLILRPTHLIWKPSNVNHILTLLNA